MANQAGKLMIVQNEPVTPDTWVNLCGINQTTFTITNGVDSEERVQCADRSQVVETIKQFGAQDVKFDASGLFDDDAQGTWLADKAFAQTKVRLRIFVPGYGMFDCDEWLISNVTFTGQPTNSLQYSFTLEASGTVTFTSI